MDSLLCWQASLHSIKQTPSACFENNKSVLRCLDVTNVRLHGRTCVRSVRAMRVKKSSSKGQGKQRASKKERDREFYKFGWRQRKKSGKFRYAIYINFLLNKVFVDDPCMISRRKKCACLAGLGGVTPKLSLIAEREWILIRQTYKVSWKFWLDWESVIARWQVSASSNDTMNNNCSPANLR